MKKRPSGKGDVFGYIGHAQRLFASWVSDKINPRGRDTAAPSKQYKISSHNPHQGNQEKMRRVQQRVRGVLSF